MRISVTKSEITKVFRRIDRVAKKNATMPILGSTLMVADGDRVTFTATDLEMVMRVTAAADITEGGTVCIPVEVFGNMVRECPEGDISIETKDGRMKVKAGNASFTLFVLPKEEFPAIEEPSLNGSIRIPGKDLAGMFQQVLFATADYDNRPTLNSVLLKGNGELAQIVATDGHRLSVIQTSAGGFSGDALIPARAASEIARFAAEEEGEVTISVNDKFIKVLSGDTVFSTRLVEGEYPDYRAVFQAVKSASRLIVDKDVLSSALNRVNIIGDGEVRGIEFSVKGNTLTLKSSNATFGEAKEEVEVNYNGAPLTVGFNGMYLREGLSVLPEGNVVLSLGADAYSPAIITSEGNSLAQQVLMPMRLPEVKGAVTDSANTEAEEVKEAA